MRYMVVGRELLSLDEEHARFRQRRLLIGCPPGRMYGPVIVLVAFGFLPWIQRVNPAPGEQVAPAPFALAWTALFVGIALLLSVSRLRRRRAFVQAAGRLGADIDVGACPGEVSSLGTGRWFEVSFSLRDGSATLVDSDGDSLMRVGRGRVSWSEQSGHSLPWSDANEGDPHDVASIHLFVRQAEREDLAGRFTLVSAPIDDPRLDDVRHLVGRLPAP